jgi:hypothetical protein
MEGGAKRIRMPAHVSYADEICFNYASFQILTLEGRLTTMRHNLMYCGIAALLVLLLAGGSSVAHEITVRGSSRLGKGPTLEAGTYRIELIKHQDSSDAVFYSGRDEVARAQVTLVAEPSKSSQTEVHSHVVDGSRVVTQIRLQGSKEKLVFDQAPDEPSKSE